MKIFFKRSVDQDASWAELGKLASEILKTHLNPEWVKAASNQPLQFQSGLRILCDFAKTYVSLFGPE